MLFRARPEKSNSAKIQFERYTMSKGHIIFDLKGKIVYTKIKLFMSPGHQTGSCYPQDIKLLTGLTINTVDDV